MAISGDLRRSERSARSHAISSRSRGISCDFERRQRDRDAIWSGIELMLVILCLGCLGSLVCNITPRLGYPTRDLSRSRGFPLPLQSQHVRQCSPPAVRRQRIHGLAGAVLEQSPWMRCLWSACLRPVVCQRSYAPLLDSVSGYTPASLRQLACGPSVSGLHRRMSSLCGARALLPLLLPLAYTLPLLFYTLQP